MPPQLPQQEDVNVTAIELTLFGSLITAAKAMRGLPDNSTRSLRDSVVRSLTAARNVSFCKLDMSTLLPQLRHVGNMDFLVLYIRGQNAAILIYPKPGAVIFKDFEASSEPESVLVPRTS